jgi:hypothetical protein
MSSAAPVAKLQLMIYPMMDHTDQVLAIHMMAQEMLMYMRYQTTMQFPARGKNCVLKNRFVKQSPLEPSADFLPQRRRS